LREASFDRCNLTIVQFTGCRGYGLRFNGCQMQGSDFAKSDFRLPVADADLVELVITDCNLSFANLAHNFLKEATLTNNRMLECCLDYCDLRDADLSGSELHGISSVGVSLAGADLRGADFSQLDPRQVDLTGTKIYQSQSFVLLDALGIILEADP
jgi:fluoroquinolone resistance protein